MGDFAALSLLSLALVLALQLLTYAISRRAGRLSVVDVTWGIGLALVALLAAAVGTGDAIEDIIEPEWPRDLTTTWGQWSPERGEIFPGTIIFVCRNCR